MYDSLLCAIPPYEEFWEKTYECEKCGLWAYNEDYDREIYEVFLCDKCNKDKSESDCNSESEEGSEYEYTNYGYNTNYGSEIIVAGGGLGNGNHTATIQLTNGKYYYREYGNHPYGHYVGNRLEYDDQGYNFNVIEENEEA